ncbi:MAG: FAD-binding oxidoreductase, partial [Deltaproteobacteria bacterium]|nr:FAD-binding oxidoreductase [Deltaproteobacteria bacterium]
IGGGIYGLVTAYHLLESGSDVLIIERGQVGMEASRANAGSIGVQNKPLKMLPATVRAAYRWEKLSEELDFDVGYERRGGFRIAHGPEDAAMLRDRIPHQQAAGVPLEYVNGKTLRQVAPYLGEQVVAATYCHLDGLADPFKTVYAYSKAVVRLGGRILDHSPVKRIIDEGSHIRLETPSESITTVKVINTAGAWAASISAMMGVSLPITWVVNMVSVTEPGPLIIPHIITHIRGNLTLKQLNGRILIGGAWRGDGNPYTGRKQVNLFNFRGNIAWASRAVPAIQRFRILRSWVGFQGQSPDRLFMMGELPPYDKRWYIMSGGSAGFSLAPIIGDMMAQWILSGSVPEGAELFDVRRYCPDYFNDFTEKN